MTWQLLANALAHLRPLLVKPGQFKVSINIVPSHLMSPGFVEDLLGIVAAAEVSPRQIVLELTEREELEDLADAAEIIAELRGRGFHVAIDDVGTGHSGLSYLQRLGANVLKVDKYFVDTIEREPTAIAVVKMLVHLAHELNMQVLAEGIETENQRSLLIECGIEQGQGYIVSPPVEARKFVEMASARGRIAKAAAKVARAA